LLKGKSFYRSNPTCPKTHPAAHATQRLPVPPGKPVCIKGVDLAEAATDRYEE
jgi:hypothetical protein